MIYKTFKEWEEGNYLEDLEPRKEAYTQQELDLIEMGWNYGVDAEREACAELMDEMDAKDNLSNYYKVAANKIRARGNNDL
jgi:hypothetical protein